MPSQQTSGKLTSLQVHDVGTGFEQPNDHLDVKIVLAFDSYPGRSFRLRIRQGANPETTKAMLDLLRDAFNNDEFVVVDHDTPANENNGLLTSVTLSALSGFHVREVPGILVAADDPILNGVRLDPAELLAEFPDTPPDEQEDPGLVEKTDWLPETKTVIQPGGSHPLALSVVEPSLLLARATWFDSPSPVLLTASLDGAEVATGVATSVPPDRGTVLLTTEIPQAGNVTVVAANGGDRPVGIQLVVGKLPLLMR